MSAGHGHSRIWTYLGDVGVGQRNPACIVKEIDNEDDEYSGCSYPCKCTAKNHAGPPVHCCLPLPTPVAPVFANSAESAMKIAYAHRKPPVPMSQSLRLPSLSTVIAPALALSQSDRETSVRGILLSVQLDLHRFHNLLQIAKPPLKAVISVVPVIPKLLRTGDR